jgi:hypothetical protein
MSLELIEPSRPTISPFPDPGGGLVERTGTELTPARSPLFVGLHQTGLFQGVEVFQDARQRHPERLRQVRDRQRPVPEAVQDLTSMSISQRRERVVEESSRRILNHQA